MRILLKLERLCAWKPKVETLISQASTKLPVVEEKCGDSRAFVPQIRLLAYPERRVLKSIRLAKKHFYLCICLFLISLGFQIKPLYAQLSSDTSTFSGEIAATCSFIDFPEEIALSWTGTRLQTNQNGNNGVFFNILANVPVDISHTGMTVSAEPIGVEASPGLNLRRRSDNSSVFYVYRTSNSARTELLNTANVAEAMKIYSWINFHNFEVAPIGRYAHSITLSCLL